MSRSTVRLLIVVLALTGCPRVGPTPMPPPVSADELLARLDAQRGAVDAIRARGRLRAGVASMWAREALVVERPRSVRVDVLSPFGLALALGTDGSTLWVFPPSEGVRYEGPASPENVARFLGAPVAVEDLVDILLGVPPKRVPNRPVHIAWAEAGGWRVTIPHRDGVQALLFDADTHRVVEAFDHHTARGDVIVRFDDYRGGFPYHIDVDAPELGVEATLRYAEVQTNPVIDAGVFRAPATVPARPLAVVAQ